jgi:broad specificity phosphatase PhoE
MAFRMATIGRHLQGHPFRLAKRIILIRHGQSEGNVDETAYETTADWQIALTSKGREQGRSAGRLLKELVGEEELMFYVSP